MKAKRFIPVAALLLALCFRSVMAAPAQSAASSPARESPSVLNPTVTYDQSTVHLSAEIVNTADRQEVVFHFEITNTSSEKTTFFLNKLYINGTRLINSMSLAYVLLEIDGRSSASAAMTVPGTLLSDITEITEISVNFQQGLRLENSETLHFHLSGCNVTAIVPEETVIAQTEDGDIIWQLLDIQQDPDGKLLLSLRVKNRSDRSFSPWFFANASLVDDVQLSHGLVRDRLTGSIEVAAGDNQDFLLCLENTETLFSSTLDSGVETVSIAASDRILQRHGIQEIRRITMVFSNQNSRGEDPVRWVTLTLKEPWMIPDEGQDRRENSRLDALPDIPAADDSGVGMADTPQYSLRLERILLGRQGFALCMEVSNNTDNALKIACEDVLVNGEECADAGYRQFTLLPRATGIWVLPLKDALRAGETLSDTELAFRCRVKDSDDDDPLFRDATVKIIPPPDTVMGESGAGIAGSQVSVMFHMDQAPKKTDLFDFDTRYICTGGEESGRRGSGEYLGQERYVIFHADGTAEFRLDSLDPLTTQWKIFGEQASLYNSPYGTGWKFTREGEKLVARKRGETLWFEDSATAEEASAASVPARVSPKRNPSVKAENESSPLSPRVLVTPLAAGLIAAFLLLRKKRKKAPGAGNSGQNTPPPQPDQSRPDSSHPSGSASPSAKAPNPTGSAVQAVADAPGAKPSSPASEPDAEEAYHGIYRPRVHYVLRYRPQEEKYTIEIEDFTNSVIREQPAPLVDTGTIDMAVFELTEAEFRQHDGETPSHNTKINELIDRLLKEKPKDRLIAAFVSVPYANTKIPLTFSHQAETIDYGALAKEKQSRVFSFIRKLKEVHVIHSSTLNGRYPAIDIHGFAQVFSEKKWAQDYADNNSEMHFSVKTFDAAGFERLVRSWYGLGIARFRLNPGRNDAVSGEINRDEYLPDAKLKQWFACGSNLCQLILRFTQAVNLKNVSGSTATAATFWNLLAHELPNTLLLTPVVYDGETEGVEDHELHLTQAAGKLFCKKTLEAIIGQHLPDQAAFQVTDSQNNPVEPGGDIGLFCGHEGYQLAQKAGKGAMLPRTVHADGKTWLCACTDFVAFEPVRRVFRNKTRVAAFTFDELVPLLNCAVSDAPEGISGIAINPDTTQLFLERKDIDEVNKLRNEPEKIYVSKKQ